MRNSPVPNSVYLLAVFVLIEKLRLYIILLRCTAVVRVDTLKDLVLAASVLCFYIILLVCMCVYECETE